MVAVRGHGGSCCGAYHVSGFGDRHGGNARDPATLQNLLSNKPNNKLSEVILSNMQAQESPALITKLQELGFVYTSAWIGNHGTHVHRFERTGLRVALNRNGFNWQGMMASATLDGNLPVIPAARAVDVS